VYLAVGAIAKIAGVITAAIIGLVGTLITAVINHANQVDAQRKQAAFMAKQENYKDLLSKVGTFARNERNDPETGDALSSAHLASWAFGDQKVLEATNKFQRRPDTETLVSLLEAVRDSLGYKDDLPEDFTRNPNRYDPKVLFPGGDKPVGGLPSGEEETQKDKLDKMQAQLDYLTQQLATQGQRAPSETEASDSQGRETGTKQKGGAYLQKRRLANSDPYSNLAGPQPRHTPHVEASEDTEMSSSPAPDTGAKPGGAESDFGHTAGKEESESTSRRWWEFWK